MARTRVKIGDVIEIETDKGLAYVQLSHRHTLPPHYGELVRVLPGLFDKRPGQFDDLVQQDELYYSFCPVSSDVRRGDLEVVAHCPVPERCHPFPVFKASNHYKPAPDMTWFLWDGETETRVEKLPPEAIDYPMCEIPDSLALAHRIASDWRPRDTVHPDSIARNS